MGIGAAAGAVGSVAGGVASMGLDLLMKANRAKLLVAAPTFSEGRVRKGSDEPDQTIEFTYNPKEFKFGAGVDMQDTPAAGADGSNRQLIGPKPREYSFEMTFDKFELMAMGKMGDASNLQKIADRLRYMAKPHARSLEDGQTPALPVVVFQWGDIHSEPAQVTDVELVYTMFLPTGDPLRLKATVKMTEIDQRVERTNPTSGSDRVRKTHTMHVGDTLASVAYREYNDAGCWRAIAAANGIDDPLRLQPGTVLHLPPYDEAKAAR